MQLLGRPGVIRACCMLFGAERVQRVLHLLHGHEELGMSIDVIRNV